MSYTNSKSWALNLARRLDSTTSLQDECWKELDNLFFWYQTTVQKDEYGSLALYLHTQAFEPHNAEKKDILHLHSSLFASAALLFDKLDGAVMQGDKELFRLCDSILEKHELDFEGYLQVANALLMKAAEETNHREIGQLTREARTLFEGSVRWYIGGHSRYNLKHGRDDQKGRNQ